MQLYHHHYCELSKHKTPCVLCGKDVLACPHATERHENATNKTAYRGSKWV